MDPERRREQRSALGVGAASVFLGACIWLISIGHSWEGVVLAVVFLITGALVRINR